MTETLAIYTRGLDRGIERRWQAFANDIPGFAKEAEAGTASAALLMLSAQLRTAALAIPARATVDFAPLAALIDRAVYEVERDRDHPGGTIRGIFGYVHMANVFECLGFLVAAETRSTILEWMPQVVVSRDDENTSDYWSTGFAALALHDQPTYQLGPHGRHIPKPEFVPGQRFEHNQQGLLGHLSRAVELGAPIESVMPAWEEALELFPTHDSAHMINEGTLFWIARVVYHRIGRFPLGTVAQRLHDDMWRLAGAQGEMSNNDHQIVVHSNVILTANLEGTGMVPSRFSLGHRDFVLTGPPGGPLSFLVWKPSADEYEAADGLVRTVRRTFQLSPGALETASASRVVLAGAERDALCFVNGEQIARTGWCIARIDHGGASVFVAFGCSVGSDPVSCERVLAHRSLRRIVETLEVVT